MGIFHEIIYKQPIYLQNKCHTESGIVLRTVYYVLYLNDLNRITYDYLCVSTFYN